VGVDRDVADADFVVQVRSSNPSAMTNIADNLAANDGLAGDDREAGEVAVAAFEAMAVVEHNLATIAVDHARYADGSIAGRANGRAIRCRDVETLVEFALTSPKNGVNPLPEAAADRSHDRPEGGDVGIGKGGIGGEAAELTNVAEVRSCQHLSCVAGHRGGAELVEGGEGRGVVFVAHRAVAKAARGACRERCSRDRGDLQILVELCRFVAADERAERKLAGGKTVNGGDFTGERAKRSGLNLFVVKRLLEVGVVGAGEIAVLAHLVEARHLDQHSRIGAGQTGDREQPDDCNPNKNIGIVHRNRHFVEGAIGVAADEQDVMALL